MGTPTPIIDIERALRELTLDEKVALLAGAGKCATTGLEERGIPGLNTSDGPHGIRTEKFFNASPTCCFPSATGIGSTFDIDLLHRIGNYLGDDARSKNVQVLLAPTVCLQRSPLIGRGFEAFGEDPVQSGLLAAHYVNGLQERGVAACIKHYAAHDQSHMSLEDNLQMTERTLRELHLMPFQRAIKDSNPWSLMTAYNKINGIHTSEHDMLIKEILRGDWGYDGLVLSDWWGTYSTSEAINAGLDIEMPGPTLWRGKRLTWAVESRKVLRRTIDESVRRVLELVNRVAPAIDSPAFDNDTESGRALVRQVAAESIVLLKNESGILPLSKDGSRRYALIGDHWKNPAVTGGGSSDVTPYYVSSPFDAIVEVLGQDRIVHEVGCYSHRFTPLIISGLTLPDSDQPGLLLEFFDKNPDEFPDAKLCYSTTTTKTLMHLLDSLPDDVIPDFYFLRVRTTFQADRTMKYRFGLSLCGYGRLLINGKESIDLWTSFPEKTEVTPVFDSFTMERFADIEVQKDERLDLVIHLTNSVEGTVVGAASAPGLRLGGHEVIDEDESIDRAVKLAQAVDVPIILTGLSSDYESEGYDRKGISLPRRVDELISRVIQANPNTVVVTQSGCAIAMPWEPEVNALVHAWFGGQETGHAIADILFGDVNPCGHLSMTFPKRIEDTPSFLTFGKADRNILYGEGVFIGHRYHEKLRIDPLFYFGHGLSYTEFKYSSLVLPPVFESDPGHVLTLSVDVTNVGGLDGGDVVQVYVADPECSVQRPVKELKAFKKVRLAAGEKQTVQLDLDKYAIAFWSEEHSKWMAEAGEFHVIVATSADPKAEVLRGTFKLEETFFWEGL